MSAFDQHASPRARKITIVAPWFFGGGAQAALVGILRRLSATGADTTLIVLFSGSTGVDALRPEVNRVVELNCAKSIAGVFSASRAIEPHLADADAVYSLMRGSHVVLGMRPTKLLPGDRTFVASFHQLPSADSAGIGGKLEDFFVRRAARRAQRITAPSRRALKQLADGGYADQDRLVYEPNTLALVDSPLVAPRTGELASVRLLFAGRLTSQKGLDRLPGLLKDVDRPVELRIAGTGPEEQRIREAIAEISDRHSVTLLGEIDDVTPHIDWCDALFMPSRTELNPVFLWEGRQRGRGAITSDIPAFEDLSQDGGIVLVPGNASLAPVIRAFAQDSVQRRTWFENLPDLARPLADLTHPSPIVSALTREVDGRIDVAAATERQVLVLHGYSAENAGDGLLVRETMDIIREALGQISVTLIASRPETFSDLDVLALPANPTKRGWDSRTLHTLKTIDDFDAVIAVGGGYLRAGTIIEAMKTALVHAPQLLAASRAGVPTLYLPQSVGPARFGTRRWLRSHLAKIDRVMVRDERSLAEFAGPTLQRVPDLATAAVAEGRLPDSEIEPIPVLSIRAVHGRVNADIYRLASLLGSYDGYVQSTTGGNDDRPAASTLSPVRTLERGELMVGGKTVRVVVAVRLHAALMALAAGHYVIHLSYERKGFGAFSDLGIDPWVHNVNRFDPARVSQQVQVLLSDPDARAEYDSRIAAAAKQIHAARADIITYVREMAAHA